MGSLKPTIIKLDMPDLLDFILAYIRLRGDSGPAVLVGLIPKPANGLAISG